MCGSERQLSCLSGWTGSADLVVNPLVKLDENQFCRRAFELGSSFVAFSELGVLEIISCLSVEFVFGRSSIELGSNKLGFSSFLFNLICENI